MTFIEACTELTRKDTFGTMYREDWKQRDKDLMQVSISLTAMYAHIGYHTFEWSPSRLDIFATDWNISE